MNRWTMNRTQWIFIFIFSIASSLQLDRTVLAQQNRRRDENSIKLPENAVVESLRARPPRTAIEVGRAVLYMARIERWDEAGRYLDQLGKAPIDGKLARTLVRTIGPGTLLRISSMTDELSKEQIAVARKITDLASETVRSLPAISEAIKLLHSDTLLDKKRGVLALQSAGEAGLMGLVESLLTNPDAPPPIVSEAIVTMGDDGKAALKAAMMTDRQDALERISLVAARIPGADYASELATALNILPSDSDSYKAIVKAFSPAGQPIPSAASAQRFVIERIEANLKELQLARGSEVVDTKVNWRLSPEGDKLIADGANMLDIYLERAYQFAVHAVRLGKVTKTDSSLAMAVILERDYRLNPTFTTSAWLTEKPNFLESHQSSPVLLASLFDVAKQFDLPCAQLRTVQQMSRVLKSGTDSASPILTRLSAAAKEASPPIRFSATIAWIAAEEAELDPARLAPAAPIEACKKEMRNLDSLPLALVVGGDSEFREILSNQLSSIGIRSITAASARETLQLVQQSHPIEMVFIVDRVREMSLSELIQRLQAQRPTSHLPIAALTDSLKQSERNLLDFEKISDVYYSNLTTNVDLTATLVQSIKAKSILPEFDSVERVVWKSIVDSPAK